MIAYLKKFVNDTIGTASAAPLNKLVGVKSVQRGLAGTKLVGADINRVSPSTRITISPVDPAKSTVLINGDYAKFTTDGTMSPAKLISLTSTNLDIGLATYDNTGTASLAGYIGAYGFSWQLIEYY